MGIELGHKILYKDLKDYALNLIKSSCWNINNKNSTSWSEYSAYISNKSTPSHFRNGASWTILTKKVTEKKTNSGHTKSIAIPNCTITYKTTINDKLLVPVYHGTIDTQLTSFLTSKGINTKSNEVVSFKGMLNFMNNLAVFMASKLVHVVNSIDGQSYIFYVASANPDTSKNAITDNNLTSKDIETNLQQIMAAINNVSNVHYASNVISYTCSSSSSSSSSSCSSSSSSSSSSMFIAYMQL